jgi:hypothetical protein
VAAFTDAGLVVRSCHELPMSEEALAGIPAYAVVPDATIEAYRDLPFVLIWEALKPG